MLQNFEIALKIEYFDWTPPEKIPGSALGYMHLHVHFVHVHASSSCYDLSKIMLDDLSGGYYSHVSIVEEQCISALSVSISK